MGLRNETFKKITAKDKKNWTPIYVENACDHVAIYDEKFGEPDTSRMIVMSKDQFRKLKKV